MDVEVVGWMYGYFEYASISTSQLLPGKLMAWSTCTQLHSFSGSIQGWLATFDGLFWCSAQASDGGMSLQPRPSETDEPRPSATDEPRPSATDEPRPSETDEPRPSATDEPRPSETDEPRPSATEAVPDVSRQPSICPDPEDLPRAPELSAAARRPECGSTPVIKTRSGRVVKKPTHYAASGK